VGEGPAWYDSIEFSAFVDAYFSLNYNFPKPQYDANFARAFDNDNGFALSWVGFDASYPADPVGATLSLRFGPTARTIGSSCVTVTAGCDSGNGLENVDQGFVSWRPGGQEGSVVLDFGKFDTPYGAEVAESHLNLNYTRGVLYWLAQPFFHTGLRATAELGPSFDLKLLAVNGWNNSLDNNVGKSFGLQGTFHVAGQDSDLLSASIGYMVGPERDDVKSITCAPNQVFDPDSATGCVAAPGELAFSSGFVDRASENTDGLRHFIDLVVLADPTDDLHLVFNADLFLENLRDQSREGADLDSFSGISFWGISAAAGYAVSDEFAIAVRGEYFSDPDGAATGYRGNEVNIVTGTLTLEFLPADFLSLRLDNRIDWSDRTIFKKEIRDVTGTQVTTTLGVVAHTN
jgi:hypothetical protein